MAEAVRPKKSKLTTSDLIKKLEEIRIPTELPCLQTDEDLDHAEEQTVAASEDRTCSTPPGDSANEVNAPKDLADAAEGDVAHSPVARTKSLDDTTPLYPSLDGEQENEQEAPRAQASAPQSSQLVEESPPATVCREYILPVPLDSTSLRNLYVNGMLDNVQSEELEFLQEIQDVGDSKGKHFFQVLMNRFTHCWDQWRYAVDRFQKVFSESQQLKENLWNVRDCSSSVQGKCQDGYSVSLKYEYKEAIFDQEAVKQLSETEDVIRWVIFEELPLVAYELARSRNEIDEYLLRALTNCPVYRNLLHSEPVRLLGPQIEPGHIAQLEELRPILIILFSSLRQHCASELHGQPFDPAFAKQLCDWLLLTGGTMLRVCRREDHMFLLMQLLRLPSKLLKYLLKLINPPDPKLAWDRTGNILDFIAQPEVELLLAMFGVCLRPVRNRVDFVFTEGNNTSEPVSSKTSETTQITSDPPWTFVDSAGESDTEESTEFSPRPTAANSQSDLMSSCFTTSGSNFKESPVFVSPHDLVRILRQLNLERLIVLLANENECSNHGSSNDTGLMTMLAFADRVMDLIVRCGDIYTEHVDAPKPQANLGSWRLLAKRLARLVSLLITTIRSRIGKVWAAQTIPSSEFNRVLSQHDALCLRACQCLLCGCGLPCTHRSAVRLVGWRYLSALFPLGLASSRSKFNLLQLILESFLPSECVSSVNVRELPSRFTSALHHALLSVGLNDIGLSAIITTLGRLAAVECRPVVVASDTAADKSSVNYQLPTIEADIVRSIVCIIFGLSIYHDSTCESSTTKRSYPIGLLPIAPNCGRRQLAEIVKLHPQVSLDLLFDLIVLTGDHLTASAELKTKSRRRSSFFGTYQFEEHVEAEELLLYLVAEAPINMLRPEKAQIGRLITCLVDQPPDRFAHLLARTLLHRLSWESLLNVETGQLFIPFDSHLDLAVGICTMVEKYLLNPARLDALTKHPVINNVFTSTKSTAFSATALLLNSLGYKQLEITNRNSRESRRSSKHLCSQPSILPGEASRSRRSRSQGSESIRGETPGTCENTLSWCVDLLLRLHLPGCAKDVPVNSSPPDLKNQLILTLQRISSCNLKRNSVAAFLTLSLYCQIYGSSLCNVDSLPLDIIMDCITKNPQQRLFMRSISLLFHLFLLNQSKSSWSKGEKCIADVIASIKDGQLSLSTGPSSLPLLTGSCLNACLRLPCSSQRLVQFLVSTAIQRTDWCADLTGLQFLDNLLQIDFWMQMSYLPMMSNVKVPLPGWVDLEVFSLFRKALEDAYNQRTTSVRSRWSAIGAVATTVWHHSSQVVLNLLGRESSQENLNVINEQEDNRVLSKLRLPRSLVYEFWPELCSFYPRPLQSGACSAPEPLWLTTSIYLAQQRKCGASTSTAADPRFVWINLRPVLGRYADELISVVCRPTATTPIPILESALALLLEKMMLEAGLLSPSPGDDNLNEEGRNLAVTRNAHAVLLQTPLVQGVSLCVYSSSNHPAFAILLHAFLCEVFDFCPASSDPSAAQRAYSIASTNPFPPGLLLLRCLPWSMFKLPTAAPTEGDQLQNTKDERSLLEVLIEKLQSASVCASDSSAEENAFHQALRSILELIRNLNALAPRFLTGNRNTRYSAFDRNFQKNTIDSLLMAYDWRSLTTALQAFTDLWNRHVMPKAFSPVPQSSTFNDSRAPNLRVEESHGNLPYFSLNSAINASISSLSCVSLERIPQELRVLSSALSDHTQRLCGHINAICELQVFYRESVIPKLYKTINVRKCDRVECQSILPAWVSRSKGCLGGALLLAEYQTAELDERMQQLSLTNAGKLKELLDTLMKEIRNAAYGTVWSDIRGEELTSRSPTWSFVGLQLEKLVSHLIELSHSCRDVVIPNQQTGLSGSSSQSIGLQSFEYLCRNLSGSLLLCPVSKRLMADCLQHLAEEFLTSLSAGYERVLDMLVALPHLSAVLVPTFIPPSLPPAVAADAPHPLAVIYNRLMDIRLRCNSSTALKILGTINISVWCTQNSEDSTTPQYTITQMTALLSSLFSCIKHLPSPETDGTTDDDRKLQDLCTEHLKALISDRFVDLWEIGFRLLLEDLCGLDSAPLWVAMNEILVGNAELYGSCSLSTEKLVVLLNGAIAKLSKPSGSSAVGRETLCDELLQSPSTLFQPVLRLLFTLVYELSGKVSSCVREKQMIISYALSTILDSLVGVLGHILIKAAVLEFHEQDSSTSAVNSKQSAVNRTLGFISDVLNKAAENCPPNENPAWIFLLLDSFALWLMTTPCPVKISKLESISSPNVDQNVKSAPSRQKSILLPILVYAAPPDDQSEVLETTHWRGLSLPWSVWKPSILTLDAMIGLLLQSRCIAHPFCSQNIASLLVHILSFVQWNEEYPGKSEQQPTCSSTMNDWRPAGVETDDDSANFAGSLTFLTLLLTQSLYRASSEVKNQLQKILESLLSSMDLSIVGERCYFFILSNLLEVHMPAHSVLMPPTSLEGRMFGLLAAAGSMISNNGSSPDSSGFYSFFCRMTKTGDTGAQLKPSLYPTLSDLPKSPITPAATHRKQLSYLRKISHLLQSALLHGHIPARDLKLLLIEPYTVEVAKSSTSQSAGAAEEEDTLFTRLTQPIGTLLKKFIPSVFNAPASPTCGNVANADPAHVLAIFSWLRIGNLLSEIEAVAGFSSWSNTSSLEFKDVAELCREVVGLVCSSWRPKAADTQPQYNQESIASFEQRSSLFSSAILFWLLGELASDIGGKTNQLAMPFKGIMPRSINAGLSMPICYTVLTSPTPSEQAQTLCLIRISEAAIWSVLNLAPANFPLHERFGSLRSLFAELLNVQSSEIFIASNGFVHNCLRDGLLLSLFLIGASRLDILQKGSTVTDSLDVLSADLLHWLNTVELRVAADNSHLQLSSFLLFLMLTVKVVSLSRTGKACCDTHPAWTRKSNTVPIQAPSCPNSATVGQLLSTMIGVQQKLVKTNPHDPDKTLKEHLEKLTIFVNCIGSLLERWLGKLDSQAHFDSLDSLGGVCTSEGGKNRDSHIPESHSAEAHAVSPTSSSISSLITRLPNMTLIEACNFTALQFWDNIQPSVKQILLSMEL